ncbi:glycosyltransferase family 2 protein [Candidatus Peregrinibacteria bacterium]|nr:glycosyltransferase family 2 protein [Candidatus Peregrinibacteria bacterium]
MKISCEYLYRRFWEIFPATLSFSLLLVPIFLSFSYPKAVAVSVVIYAFLWFMRTVEYSVFLIFSFWKFKKSAAENWAKKIISLETGECLTREEKNIRDVLIQKKDWISPREVKHLVIIAMYDEDIEILRETFFSLQNSDFDLQKLFVCLATEERKSVLGRKNSEILKHEFSGIFGNLFFVEHPGGISGEVQGKGSNISFAVREVSAQIALHEDLRNILVTTLDSDNKVDVQYFSCLTYHFCLQNNRQKQSYQPLPLFYNNIWDVPLLNRILAISSGFWHMIESGRPDRLRNFSSHAQPLLALQEMNYWAVDTIVEDGHQFWRSFLHFKGEYEVVPLFIPIYQDAVLNANYYRSVLGQYKQMRRWAWGCSDIPFCAVNFWKKRRELPLGKTILQFVRLVEGHIMWATTAIFVTFTIRMPQIVSSEFSETNISVNLAYLLQNFFGVAIIGIVLSMTVSLITLPKAPTRKKFFSLFWQWIFLPIVIIIFGSFPALDAQIRLFLKKPLEFNVTEKKRISKEVYGHVPI